MELKIYVMCDLEGTAGLVLHEQQCQTVGAYYQQARRLATLELNALVEGALAGGATEVIAWDGHGGFPGGLDVELLHPDCQLEMGSGDGGPQGLDGSFTAAMQLGMHAMAGTANAPMAHSFNMHYKSLLLNGREVGELAMNCLLAASFGIPTIFLAGDQAATAEALHLVPNMEIAAVKRGISPTACISLAPARACQVIRDGARRAVERFAEILPFQMQPPYTLVVEYRAERFANAMLASGNRRISRINTTSIEVKGDKLQDLVW